MLFKNFTICSIVPSIMSDARPSLKREPFSLPTETLLSVGYRSLVVDKIIFYALITAASHGTSRPCISFVVEGERLKQEAVGRILEVVEGYGSGTTGILPAENNFAPCVLVPGGRAAVCFEAIFDDPDLCISVAFSVSGESQLSA